MSLGLILGLSLGLGIPLLVGTILLIVFKAVRRRVAQMRAALESEGVVRESGPRWVTIRFSGYSEPGYFCGAGLHKTRMSIVLTKRRLSMLPAYRHWSQLAISDLGRYKIEVADDGALHMHSDSPSRASGSIDYRFSVDDAGGWVKALTEASPPAGEDISSNIQ